MNNPFSKFLCVAKTRTGRITFPVSKTGGTGFLVLVVLAFWLQSFSPSEAQDATTNSSPSKVADDKATNAPATAPPVSTPPGTDEAPATAPSPGPSSVDTNSLSTSPVSGMAPPDNSPPSLEEAARLYMEGKSDEALSTVNAVLETDPTNLNAYILRGAIYARKQAWDQAEKDYETALQMDPKNDGVRYDLADLKFKQKQFDAAREAFVPLQDYKDSTIRDLIKYKIFLCDLFAGHDDVAGKELDVFNQAESNGSYYFGNAAWDLVHKKMGEARNWLASASHIYPDRKKSIYESSLRDMGYLPLPPDSNDE